MCRNEHFIALRDEIDNQVLGLKDRRYGWDGHQALPMRDDSYVFLSYGLWSRVPGDLPPLPHPEVELSPSGGVVIQLDKEDRHLRVVVPCGRVVTYHRLWDSGASMEGEIHFDENIFDDPQRVSAKQFADELRWLATGS